MTSPKKCGFVALLGQPNAGKSTLLNVFLDASLAAVSPKPQTTRFPIRGISIVQQSQIVVVDTPGLLAKPQSRLEKSMIQAAQDAPFEADVVLVVVDVTKSKKQLARALEHIKGPRPRLWVALNKIDKIKKEELLTWAAAYGSEADRIFMISAAKKNGTKDLHHALADVMPEGAWLFEDDMLTTLPERLWAAEITREVLLRMLGQELPHKLYVETEEFTKASRGFVRIHQVIHVAEKNHKKMILGRAGQMIKEISIRAREAMCERLGRKVHLFLYVRHTPLWEEKADFYRLVGLPFS